MCTWEHSKSKAIPEKECNHVDKSACFQPNNSENLKIFLCACAAKGGYCEREGNFLYIWPSVSCSMPDFTDINPFLHINFLHHLKDLGVFISILLTVIPNSEWLNNLSRVAE